MFGWCYDFTDWRKFLRMCLPLRKANLVTGEGHGHARSFNRERPPKDRVKKARKRTKMKKASRRRNRG